MGISHKTLAGVAATTVLAVTPVAIAANPVSVATTPKVVKAGKKVEMLVRGMKPNERVKAFEVSPNGQKRALYPRAGAAGSLLVQVKAEIKGKHKWTFTGRSSKRHSTTYYTVK